MSDYSSKELLIFDLDGTLAPSKSFLEKETAILIANILNTKKVAVISGGNFDQFNKQFLSQLELSSEQLHNLYLLPVTGTQMYSWNNDQWIKKYHEENFTDSEREKILSALPQAVSASGVAFPETTYGEQIEDRGKQITFSALGQDAPIDAKSAWDPTHEKRQHIISVLKTFIPEFPINMGGMTSIDIGWDKGQALEKFSKEMNVSKEKILFFGDALFPGGNDYPAQEIGLESILVKDPADTRTYLKNMLCAKIT